MADVTVSEADWAAVVGAVFKEDTDELNVLFDRVDKANSLTRYYLYAKWMDGAAKRPGPDDEFEDWPPWVSEWFVQYEAFTRAFVEDYVATRTDNAIYTLVTDDPEGEVGWYELEDFFNE